ncbi:glycosyltransferase family 4 protein [Noviherbaspirillum saxi]|uniref:Glycosyltransferase n=1 Tax=Noviherbaspirillum saxi TaxID=2320863 RepID=A0A3A3FQ80_9BURK|nr:glycosyltransferase family 4 protein [Noviherbaspirillum saxi]RJF98362.1 glycosyltransferase [Noviherbaspirillum saxi]
MIKLAVITNEPPPYRIPVFNRIARMPGITLQVIFCARREPNRHWDLPAFEFDHCFLRERITTVNGRYIHNNPDVIPALRRFAPNVIVSDGLNPTQLYAFGYALFKGIPHVPLTDGTYESESGLSKVHKLIRSVVYGRSKAYLSASMGGQRLFESYGVTAEQCFKSYLCIDNDVYQRSPEHEGDKFDLIFCGRMVSEKGPMFALDVAEELSRKLGRKASILFVGSGSEEERVKSAAQGKQSRVAAYFHGFAKQGELPALYRSARVFLFPTHADVWGVVANEACAAGLPVIVTPYAGAAGELVVNGENGFVAELDVGTWAQHATTLLSDQRRWENFSRRSLTLVREYSFDNAAIGVVDACRYALSSGESRKENRAISS